MNPEKEDGTERAEELRAFLLGTLAETALERVEHSLLADEELYEVLLATEEELIDEYLSGALSPSEASSFLRYLGNLPDGKRRIDFARDLKESVTASEKFLQRFRSRWESGARGLSRHLRLPRPAWAAAALLCALGFLIYASMAFREPTPLVLTAGLMRGEGEISTATLSASKPTLRVMLDLAVNAHVSYRATLYDAESRVIFATEGLTASVTETRILVELRIPAEGLEPGDYYVFLAGRAPSTGYEPIGRYDFRIVVD
jgi:hypothetical protein